MVFIAKRGNSSVADNGDFIICGLVGAAGDLMYKHEKFFRIALILDTVRGIDSTGAAIIKPNGQLNLAKKLGHAYELLDSQKFNTGIQGLNRVLIGHNRWATQGGVNTANAHPYEFDTLVGAHNGTLKNKWNFGQDHNRHPVDSYCLYSHLNEHGAEETIPLMEGAWALTWYSFKDKTINMIRNQERPLFIATEEKTGNLLWASEPWMVQVAADKAELKISRPVQIDEDTLYSWAINEKGGLVEQNQKKIFGKQTPFHQASGSSKSGESSTKTGAKPNQSITPTGKVVTFPIQQGQSSSPAMQTGYKIGYAGTTDVRLEVLGEGVDMHGARYISCFDPANPNLQLRLYISAREAFSRYDGRIIIGTIGKYHMVSGTVSKGYYKIEFSSHRLEKEEKLYPNEHGELIEEEEWVEKFGTCQWCSTNIFPDEVSIRFIETNGKECGALCPECVADEEVGKYVRFK